MQISNLYPKKEEPLSTCVSACSETSIYIKDPVEIPRKLHCASEDICWHYHKGKGHCIEQCISSLFVFIV